MSLRGWGRRIALRKGDGADSIELPLLGAVVLGGKRADELAVFEFELPAQVLTAIEREVGIEVELRAVGLGIERAAGGAVAVELLAGELAVLAFEFETLALLAVGAGLIGGVGHAGPATRQVLGEEGAGAQQKEKLHGS